jgi:hypothetical protein
MKYFNEVCRRDDIISAVLNSCFIRTCVIGNFKKCFKPMLFTYSLIKEDLDKREEKDFLSFPPLTVPNFDEVSVL